MRVLLVVDAIGIGGVSTAFLNYVKVISKYSDCDLIIFDDENLDRSSFPSTVNILSHSKLLWMLGMPQEKIKRSDTLLSCFRIILICISRIINGRFARKLLLGFVRQIGKYDVAISYVQDVGWKSLARGCNDFVLDKVDATTKCAFIHCDYEKYGGYHPKQEQMYKRFDYIFAVSEGCENSFCKCFPRISEKVLISENFIDCERVRQLSSEYYVPKNDGINIVTVCRISEEKGIARMINVISRIVQERINNQFHWRVVGNGEKLSEYEDLIKRMELTKYIEFVGEKQNPYPYIQNSDVFLLPSFHEAAPMVFGECAALKIPIISTKTSSAIELVEKRKIGFVCDNSEEGLYNALNLLLSGKMRFNEIYLNRNFEPNYYSTMQLENILKMIGEEK